MSILQHRGAWQFVDNVQKISDPSTLADTAGYASYLDVDKKLWLLATANVDERLERLVEWGRAHLAELEVSEQINDDVREGIDKSQREFLLRQQLAAIRKELGEGSREGREDYRSRWSRTRLPEKVRGPRCARSTVRASGEQTRRPAGSARGSTRSGAAMERSHDDKTNIVAARAVLDADHKVSTT